jgi:hypothetical protein
VVLSSGPQIFDTAGVLRIPKLVSGATVGFVGEGQLIADTADVDLDELVLMPTERKSIKTILKYTNELVRQSVIGIDVVVTHKLPQGTAVLADTSQIAIARDIAPSVTVLTERSAEYDQIGLRVVTRYDLGLLHPEGVIVLTVVCGS